MKNKISYKESLLFILSTLKPFPKTICLMLWVALFWSIDLSLRPYILKTIINKTIEIDQSQIFAQLLYPTLYYLALTFIMFNSARLNTYFVDIQLNPSLRKNIAMKVIQKILNRNYNFYQNTFSGGLAAKINDLTFHVPDCLQIIFDRFLSYFFALIIAFFFLWEVHYLFAVIMGVWSSLFILFVLLSANKLIYLSSQLAKKTSTVTGKLIDTLTNIQSVFLFGQKTYEKKLLENSYELSAQSEKQLHYAHFLIWIIYDYSFFVILALNFFFLLKGRQEGWITIGDFILVIRINLGIVDFLWKFTREFTNFTKALGKITDALETIGDIEVLINKSGVPLKIKKAEIVFKNVYFNYLDSKPLFNNFNLKILGGQKIGIVGYSGSGKTSLINIFLRLFDPSSGNILIDEQNIHDFSEETFYNKITIIPQEPILFHRSIYDNICYGNPYVNDQEVINASKKAHIYDFIVSLKDGYKTLVGERGIKLSGGQKQRISIARAFLKNSPILILDEATSQIDSITEKIIQNSIVNLIKDKTVIVIAHRISTLGLMDRIIVLNQGKIVGDGTHEELLLNCDLYIKLWNNQVQGFLL